MLTFFKGKNNSAAQFLFNVLVRIYDGAKQELLNNWFLTCLFFLTK